jgi:putative endonuclease
MFAHIIFAMVDFAARKGLAVEPGADGSSKASVKLQARRTGVRGETYAYWYLRRHGYTLVARNYTLPGMKGELDIVGYDGRVLAFVEVKTRVVSATARKDQPKPEDAVNAEKRGNLSRIARQFLRTRRLESAPCRFDVLAIETSPGIRPEVRLHKGAFAPE